jgi:carboxymethylenebutenolidase
MPQQAVDIPTPDGVMDAKLFSPEGQGPWPGVVMISDAGGSRPTYDAMAQRLADAGYVVLLPHVYYRAGRAQLPQLTGGTMADETFRKSVMGLLATLTPERLRTDAAAEVGFLAAQPQVKGRGLGVVGYCMGGAVAMRMMAHFPEQVVAAASYHGGFLATDDANSPHLLADKLKGELYFGHADQDAFMDAQAIARLDEALTQAGVRYTAELYTGAHHGYAVQGSPAFSQPAADKHWRTMLELFGRTLRA